MVEKRNCSFCGEAIEPGTGKMYVKKDGTVYNFCSNKCKKNNIDLERVSRRTRWTVRYAELKAGALGTKEPEAEEKAEEEKPAKKPAAKPKKAPEAKPKAKAPAAAEPKKAPTEPKAAAKKKEAPKEA